MLNFNVLDFIETLSLSEWLAYGGLLTSLIGSIILCWGVWRKGVFSRPAIGIIVCGLLSILVGTCI